MASRDIALISSMRFSQRPFRLIRRHLDYALALDATHKGNSPAPAKLSGQAEPGMRRTSLNLLDGGLAPNPHY